MKSILIVTFLLAPTQPEPMVFRKSVDYGPIQTLPFSRSDTTAPTPLGLWR